jgi:hypothetical protein
MNSKYEDTFALQRLYEKWVVKEEWSVYEEALPLLLGLDPAVDYLNSDYHQLQLEVNRAVIESEFKLINSDTEVSSTSKVKPATIYQWAMKKRLSLPMELVNLMEFVLKTILLNEQEPPSVDLPAKLSTSENDMQKILGACFSVIVRYPEECRNSRGVVKTERILKLVDQHSDKLFEGQLPNLSSTAIRDIVNRWMVKLD